MLEQHNNALFSNTRAQTIASLMQMELARPATTTGGATNRIY
jgi:hypothetical protein